jgi:hypothetical protein
MKWSVLFPVCLLFGCLDFSSATEKFGRQLTLEDVSWTNAWIRLSGSPNSNARMIDFARERVEGSVSYLSSPRGVILALGLKPTVNRGVPEAPDLNGVAHA